MIKLKDILKEGIGGFINTPAINEGPDADLFGKLWKIDDQIIKLMISYSKKADTDKIAQSWMAGLHAKLKKAGIKLW